MNTAIDTSEEEILTWVNDNKKAFIKDFFGPFHDIFDHYLLEVVNCKKVDEYIEVEQKYISTTISKPGKIPIRLNKTEMKVPAVYYFLALFLIKWARAHTQCMIETLLHRERTAEVKYEQIKMQNAEILKNFEDLENFTADASLTSGLMIQDLENRIRNLEADVIAKERIILEKNEANNILWEKIKALETKEEKSTGQVTNMKIDNKTQKKKKRPNNKKRKRARSITKTGTITDIVIDKKIKIKNIWKNILPRSHVTSHFMMYLGDR